MLKRKRLGHAIRLLQLHHLEPHAAPVKTAGCPRFEAACGEPQRCQRFTQADGRAQLVGARASQGVSDDHTAVQKGTGTQDDILGSVKRADRRDHAFDASIVTFTIHQQTRDLLLDQYEIRLFF